jgi:hypothetical protein
MASLQADADRTRALESLKKQLVGTLGSLCCPYSGIHKY